MLCMTKTVSLDVATMRQRSFRHAEHDLQKLRRSRRTALGALEKVLQTRLRAGSLIAMNYVFRSRLVELFRDGTEILLGLGEILRFDVRAEFADFRF